MTANEKTQLVAQMRTKADRVAPELEHYASQPLAIESPLRCRLTRAPSRCHNYPQLSDHAHFDMSIFGRPGLCRQAVDKAINFRRRKVFAQASILDSPDSSVVSLLNSDR